MLYVNLHVQRIYRGT